MIHLFFDQLSHFASQVLATCGALITVTALIKAFRRFGWRWPTDPLSLADALLHPMRDRNHRLNVEFRDSNDEVIDLGPLVTVLLRNGRGRPVKLEGGVFAGCDPEHVSVGKVVHVIVEGGVVNETARIQVDLTGQTLFVRLRRTLPQLVDDINLSRS